MSGYYNRTKLVAALRDAGLRPGCVVFSHSNLGFFGLPEETRAAPEICELFLQAFTEVLGPEGTLCVPTFTYSFCKSEPFDPLRTPAPAMGMFSEYIRQRPGAERSEDPIFSVAALGSRARELTSGVSEECFGPGSFWERFSAAGGILCNLNFDAGSTFLHYAERKLGVSYRYDKVFPGTLIHDGVPRSGRAIFFCQDASNPDTAAAFELFDRLARERGVVRRIALGRGSITALSAQDAEDTAREGLARDPWFLTVASREGRTPALQNPAKPAILSDPPVIDVADLVARLALHVRDIVSPGYDAALELLGSRAPMTVHAYPTGMRVGQEIVPEAWECTDAYVESLGGERIMDQADKTALVSSYSLPVDAVIKRPDLLGHLQVSREFPEALPFTTCRESRDWGLTCQASRLAMLTEDEYHVVIRSRFSFGTMKVGEVVVEGDKPDTIVYAVHLEGRGLVHNATSAAVAGEWMRSLGARSRPPEFTHSLLLLPGELGLAAHQARRPGFARRVRAILFLEMLGLGGPLSIQCPPPHTFLAERLIVALKAQEPVYGPTGSWCHAWQAVSSDTPVLTLARGLPGGRPFEGFETSFDGPSTVSRWHLEASLRMLAIVAETLEAVLKSICA